jgi:hypothetical protein
MCQPESDIGPALAQFTTLQRYQRLLLPSYLPSPNSPCIEEQAAQNQRMAALPAKCAMCDAVKKSQTACNVPRQGANVMVTATSPKRSSGKKSQTHVLCGQLSALITD